MNISNWTLPNGHGRIGVSSAKVPIYELSSLNARERNRGPINPKHSKNLRHSVSMFTWLTILNSLSSLLLVGFICALLIGCGVGSAKAHEGFYLELGIGKNDVFGENDWIGRDSAGCNLGGGFIYAPTPRTQIDLGFSHYSQCTRGNGFDNRSEDDLDVIYLKGRFFL